MWARGFDELQRQGRVAAYNIRLLLADYALIRAAIAGDVVIDLLRGATHKATAEDLAAIVLSCRQGEKVHEEMRESKEVAEYRKVRQWAEDALQAMKSKSTKKSQRR